MLLGSNKCSEFEHMSQADDNARQWLPMQTEHGRTDDRVYPSSIASILAQFFEQIACRI